MQSSDLPDRVPLPFAASGGRSTIPVPSQIGITDGAASLTDGFPLLTRTPPSGGGIPPSGLEMNGILYLVSAGLWWLQAGGSPRWDATHAAAIGGYANGAVLQSADGDGWWRCTTDNNSTNPDAGGAGWTPHLAYGQTAATLASSNVTLTAAQSLKPQIVLTGALGANINLIFPATLQQWLVVNATTGAYAITAKTAGGTGVVLAAGPNQLYGDGANIQSVSAGLFAANQLLADPGYRNLPGGLIEKWGSFYVGNAPSGNNVQAIAFQTAFPTAVLKIHLDVQDQSTANNLVVSWKNPTVAGFDLQYQETSAAVQNATVHYTAMGY